MATSANLVQQQKRRTSQSSQPPQLVPRCLSKKQKLEHFLQKSLVYITGVPESALACNLESPRYFGRFGPIKSLHCAMIPGKLDLGELTVATHILYENEEDALLCIFCCNISTFSGHQLKASRGTNKLCRFFAAGSCPNPQCTFMHERSQFAFRACEMTIKNRLFVDLTNPAPPPMIDFVPCDFFRDTRIPDQPPFPRPVMCRSGCVAYPNPTDLVNVRRISSLHTIRPESWSFVVDQEEEDPQIEPVSYFDIFV